MTLSTLRLMVQGLLNPKAVPESNSGAAFLHRPIDFFYLGHLVLILPSLDGCPALPVLAGATASNLQEVPAAVRLFVCQALSDDAGD